MAGMLLDTHALIWPLASEPMDSRALLAIAEAQANNSLFVSPVSAWEVAVAAVKPNPARRPALGGLSPEVWFRRGVRLAGARTALVSLAVGIEAAKVTGILGTGDPGDCFLVATARVRGLALVTRDSRIVEASRRNPGFLPIVRC